LDEYRRDIDWVVLEELFDFKRLMPFCSLSVPVGKLFALVSARQGLLANLQ